VNSTNYTAPHYITFSSIVLLPCFLGPNTALSHLECMFMGMTLYREAHKTENGEE